MVIDDDLGQSGAQAAGRAGFQRLVADVGLGQVGIVLSLEVSRLARNSSDWHRLLELCALSDTLILDEDGLYDPNQFNDRLVLGLRGTMSEAELHFLRVRLEGGKLNKARRGELRTPLPAGLVYDADGRIALDPDRQVRQALQQCVDRGVCGQVPGPRGVQGAQDLETGRRLPVAAPGMGETGSADQTLHAEHALRARQCVIADMNHTAGLNLVAQQADDPGLHGGRNPAP